jgi:hypothetical protein
LKTSSNEKFWAFSFLQSSLNNPMCTMYLSYVLRDWKFCFASSTRSTTFKSFWELLVMKSFEHFHFKWILWAFLCLVPMLICCLGFVFLSLN